MKGHRKTAPKTPRRHSPQLEKALELFRRWGREGARRRSRALSPERRREIARKAAKARWDKEIPAPVSRKMRLGRQWAR